jgi:hypothetical protein
MLVGTAKADLNYSNFSREPPLVIVRLWDAAD